MVAVLIKTKKTHFCEDSDHDRSTTRNPIRTQKHGIFCEDYDHGRSPNKDSQIGHFCEDCDHNRSPLYSCNLHFRSDLLFLKRLLQVICVFLC